MVKADRWRPSCRVVMSWVGMFGFTCVYAIRFNLSVAIVCMVKETRNFSSSSSSSLDNVSDEVYTDTGCEEGSVTSTDWSMFSSYFPQGGTIEWDRQLRGYILSSFFYGYIITQIPGGWLAGYYGGKGVFGFGMLITTIATFLMPVAATTHFSLVIILRVIMGLGTGVVFPAMHSLWGRWAPPLERTKLMSVCYAGTFIGNIMAFFLSGWLCEVGFAGGWPSIFYVFGIMCTIFLIMWQFLVYDSPQDHPRVSDEERSFIDKTVGVVTRNKTSEVPWKDIITSPPVWACTTAHVCNNWGNYALSTGLPSYMKDVLKFDMKQNGLYSALPYLCMWVTSIGVGFLVDFLRTKGVRTVITRKAVTIVATALPAALLTGVGFLTCEHRELAVALLVLSLSGVAFCRSGYSVNHVDIAPKYAGVLFGLTNTAATLPGMIAPTVMGSAVTEGTQSEYQLIFYICAGFYTFGMVIFLVFASGETQAWAIEVTDIDFDVDEKRYISDIQEEDSDEVDEFTRM